MKKKLLIGLLCAMLFTVLLLTAAFAEGETANTYTVTLDSNGGTGGTASVTATYDAAMPAITLPGRTGYTFNGYYDAATGGIQYYSADGSSAGNWDKAAEATLYARWTLNTYTVTYDDNGATTAHTGGDTSYTIETVYFRLATPPSKTGYFVTSWKVTNGALGGTGFSQGDEIYSLDRDLSGAYGDVTIQVQWAAQSYVVGLKANGGTSSGVATIAYYDAAMPVITPPYRTGYAFAGYYDAVTGGTQYYNADGTGAKRWDKSAPHNTLYAQWTANEYAVTLDREGGQTGATSVTVTYDSATITGYSAPTRTGYSFGGYWSGDDGTGSMIIDTTGTMQGNVTNYTGDGGVWKRWSSPVTLYARWTANEYAVTLDGQNATTAGTTSATATYDAAMPGITVPRRAYTVTFEYGGATGGDRPGSKTVSYTFDGYFSEIVGGTQYVDGDGEGTRPWDLANGATLYAHWTAGSCALPKLEKTNYDFGGWYADADFNERVGFGGDAYTPTEDVTLYARWSPFEYAVYFYADDATTPPSGGDLSYSRESTSITLPTPPGKTGYTFAGWKVTVAALGGTGLALNDVFTGTSRAVSDAYGPVTTRAQWTANEYAVTLDGQNATTAGTTSATATYDIAMPFITLPGRTGYTFAGYYDAQTGGTQYYNADGGSVRNWDKAAEATLYARWTANTYTVTLNPDGGTGGTVSATATYDAAMPAITLPGRAGYTFAGYYDAQTGGTKYYNADGGSAGSWDKAAEATLYAWWTLNTYTVTYDDNGATTAHSGGDTSYTIEDTSLTLPAAPGKTGYTFRGWKVTGAAQGGTGLALNKVLSDTSRAISGAYGNITLCAKWVSKAYAVTLTSGEGYTLTAMPGSVSPVDHGDHYTFAFTLDPAYSASTPSVMVNGIQVNLKNGVYTIRQITRPITVSVTGIVRGYPIVLDGVEMSGAATVEIDGLECALIPGISTCTTVIPGGKSRIVVVTTESGADTEDVYTRHPSHMMVWELSFHEDTNSYTSNRIEEFDDLLQFAGCSIELNGSAGIRMDTSVPTRIFDRLMGSGVDGYTLEEIGTLSAWVSEMGEGTLTLGQSYVHSTYAYKRGIVDNIFRQDDELSRYSYQLTDFTMDQCISDLVMRPYIILRDANGDLHTLYGGTVQRSIAQYRITHSS